MSWLSDLDRILRGYRKRFGHYPNLLFPKTFTEKMQVAKLTWRSPLLPVLSDKIEVKHLIAKAFGAELVTPSLYEGDWLPPREQRNWPFPYVIKASHASAANVFVRSVADIDWDAIEKRLRTSLSRPYGQSMGEWAYSRLKPRVLVEPFIGGEDVPPADFKLYTFGGRVELISVAHGRLRDLRYGVYDRNWTLLPLLLAPGGRLPLIDSPKSLPRMLEVAEEIGKRLPFCRVDFYDIDGKARFGEVTLYPSSGFMAPDPPEYDRVMGALFPRGKPANRW